MRTLLALALVAATAAGGVAWWRDWPPFTAEVGTAAAGPGQGGRRSRGTRENEGPVPVLTAPAVLADVPVEITGIGTVQASKTATVRAQVSGKLVAVGFDEGQEVAAGALLARIDPVLFQATHDEAVARKQMDQALLENAKRDLDRYVNLAKTDYATKQQADTARATLGQLAAQVRQDQAAIDSTKANLEYTEIRAPIAGRTGIRQVDEGNLVSSADATGIVVITQLRPIAVLFTLPETAVGAVNAAMARGPVTLEASVGGTVLDRGTVEVVDNQIEQATGTIRIKGTFPNAQAQLWPGQFVNVRLHLRTLDGVTVVPIAAVQQGPSGTFVYRVDSGSRARLAPVQIAQEDERQAVIANGLDPGDRVVTTGFSRLQDGAEVTFGEAVPVASTDPVGPR